MAEYPYMNATSKIEDFFVKIKRMGAPPSLTKEWLDSIGFTSQNDRRIKRVLEQINFIDSAGSRTSKWDDYLEKSKAEAVMAGAILEGYSNLFDAYPDAYQRTDEELKSFFWSSDRTLSPNTVMIMVNTFKTLCSMADFSAALVTGASSAENGNMSHAKGGKPLVTPPQPIESPTPTLHIDFQVHIAADAPPEQIDQIFESMAKHLYGKVTE